MHPPVRHLEENTLNYWRVSRAYNNRGEKIEVGNALRILKNTITHTPPQTKLFSRLTNLQSSIIYGPETSPIQQTLA